MADENQTDQGTELDEHPGDLDLPEETAEEVRGGMTADDVHNKTPIKRPNKL